MDTGKSVMLILAVATGIVTGTQLDKLDRTTPPPKTIFSDVDCDRATSSTTYNVAKEQEGTTSYQCVDIPGK